MTAKGAFAALNLGAGVVGLITFVVEGTGGGLSLADLMYWIGIAAVLVYFGGVIAAVVAGGLEELATKVFGQGGTFAKFSGKNMALEVARTGPAQPRRPRARWKSRSRPPGRGAG